MSVMMHVPSLFHTHHDALDFYTPGLRIWLICSRNHHKLFLTTHSISIVGGSYSTYSHITDHEMTLVQDH